MFVWSARTFPHPTAVGRGKVCDDVWQQLLAHGIRSRLMSRSVASANGSANGYCLVLLQQRLTTAHQSHGSPESVENVTLTNSNDPEKQMCAKILQTPNPKRRPLTPLKPVKPEDRRP